MAGEAIEPAGGGRKRGGALVAWLVFLGIFGVLSLVLGVLQGATLAIVLGAALLLCAIGVGLWFRLAFFGLMAVLGVFIVLSMLTGNVSGVVMHGILLVLTVALIHPRLAEFR